MAKKNTSKSRASSGKGKAKSKVRPSFWKQTNTLIALAVVLLITFLVFSPSLDNDFVNWDDDVNLLENPNLERFDMESVKGIFTDRVIGNYNPLPIFTFAIEKHVLKAGNDPYLYHLNNILFHLVCVFFVFRIGLMMGLKLPAAIFLALLFGIHPMRVESVTWITERKDVLFGAFFLSAFFTYLKYLKGKMKERQWWYFTIGLFLVGLFAKIQMVALPLALLAADYFMKRKLQWKLLIEKIPLFALSLLFGLLGIYFLAENESLLDSTKVDYNFFQRLLIGAYSFIVYIVKAVVPYEMSPLYPYPSALDWKFYLAPLLAGGVFALGYLAYRRKSRAIVFGLAFFFFTVVFVLQVLGAGQGFLADRFTYIPYFGLFFIAAYYLQQYVNRPALRIPLYGIAGAYLIFCSVLTWRQCDVWQNSYDLWTHVLKYYDRTSLPYRNRGHFVRENGDAEAALQDYAKAVKLNPNDPDLRNSRGKTFFDLGRFEEALGEYDVAITVNPNKAEYLVNRGAAMAALGDYVNSLKDFNEAARLKPDFANVYLNRSLVYYRLKNFPKALEDLDTYLTFNPDRPDIYYERALNHRQMGNEQKALEDLNKAISLDPGKGMYYFERAKVRSNLGDKNGAVQDGKLAQRFGMDIGEDVLYKLGN
jgi:tetratricopeptide (TPR) repeat protein